MTPQVLHCNTTVYGFGDNTAGPIWRNSVSPDKPLWGYESITNYPYGENLATPVNYSASIQYTAYWLSSKVAGPICGYNIINFAGFVVSAMVMYGFIYALTRNRWVAWLAGYAVSFSPYFQVKVGGHPGYGYQALLVGLLWLFYNVLKHQKKRYAIGLGVLYASCFYFDPYFSLLATLLLGSLGGVWLLVIAFSKLYKKKNFAKYFGSQFKLFALAIFTALILLVPLLTIRATQSAAIDSYVSSSRGNVLAEAQACSIYPYQYAVPFVLNPIYTRLLGGQNYKTNVDNVMNHFPCGIGEASVGISAVILLVVASGFVIILWESANRRKLHFDKTLRYEPVMLLLGVTAVGLVAVAVGLPPIKIGPIPTPSWVLIDLTTTWRTLARVYLLVNISAIILFSVALAYYAQHFKIRKRTAGLLLFVIFMIIFAGNQAFRPFAGNKLSNYNYKTNPPAAYVWLASQNHINAIAEYPLERSGGESNANAYYLTMQSTHKKKLFNSALPNSPQENIRASLKDLSDPQTVRVLYAYGIDAVVVHGVPAETIAKIPNLKVVYSAPQSSYNLLAYTPLVTDDNIVIAKIVAPAVTTKTIQLSDKDFPRNTTIIKSSVDWSYETLQGAVVNIVPISKGRGNPNINTQQNVCFMAKMAIPSENDTLTLIVDGKPQEPIRINGSTYTLIQATATKMIKLQNSSGHNMQIADIGCK